MEAVTPQEILDTPNLIAAGIAGDEVRRRMHGTTTTFVRVLETHVDVPLTSLPAGAQPGQVTQLSRIDDDDPVSQDVQSVFPADKLALLRHGLSLDGQPLQRAKVEWQNPEQLRFVLTEGKKRQIRRMCEQVGLKVVGLKRVRIGKVKLGDLPVGQWRYLRPEEQF